MPQEIIDPSAEFEKLSFSSPKIEPSNSSTGTFPLYHNSSSSSMQSNRPPQSPPVSASHSASHTQLNSDIQARLMAFQQKRSKPVGTDHNTGSGNISMTNSPNSTSLNLASLSSTNADGDYAGSSKPLPPLPHAPEYNKRSFSSNDKLQNECIPSVGEYSLPMVRMADEEPGFSPAGSAHSTPLSTPPSYSIGGLPSGASQPFPRMPSNATSITPNTSLNSSTSSRGGISAITSPGGSQFQNLELKKRPSLSQRRGMKLNMGDLNKSSPIPSPSVLSPPINFKGEEDPALNGPITSSTSSTLTSNSSIISTNRSTKSATRQFNTTGELSRRLSERKNKPNFKLNLDSTNSDLPLNGNSSTEVSRNSSLNRNDSLRSSNEGSVIGDSESETDKKPQLQGLFANYSKYVDIKSGQLNFAGKASLHSKGVDFSSGSSFRISLDELEYIEELGRGNYGSVSKVLHKPTGVLMAMKEVRLELDETKFTQILMELEILHKCDSPYIVDFYGAFFVEGAVYMCIEYMNGGSLDKIYGKDHGVKDEPSLAYITECVIRGLKDLKDEHNIIHRDVKPTNILVNTAGKVKLCDFGVSGNLVASLAKTNIGCQSYMAPERIKTLSPDDATYSVQSDIWSLGLTILELAAGHYPYPAETYDNIFSQLSAIVDGEPPKLDPTAYSKEAQIFVKSCLNKNPDLRPSYAALLNNPWLVKYRSIDPHLDVSVTARVKQLAEEKEERGLSRSSSLKNNPLPTPANIESVHSLLRNKVKAPALHRGGLPSNNRSFLNRQKE